MLKKCKVVMLSTNEKAENCLVKYDDSHLIIKFKPDYYYTQDYLKSIYCKGYHLYIVSDDLIKKGDWYLRFGIHPTIAPDDRFCEHEQAIKDAEESNNRKIIATTNTFLDVSEENKSFKDWKLFPKLSVGFIEKYIEKFNRHRDIEEVLVEYSDSCCNIEVMGGLVSPDCCGKPVSEPNINRDHCITVKPVKISWTKDEMLKNLNEYTMYVMKYIRGEGSGDPLTPEQWLKNQNL